MDQLPGPGEDGRVVLEDFDRLVVHPPLVEADADRGAVPRRLSGLDVGGFGGLRRLRLLGLLRPPAALLLPLLDRLLVGHPEDGADRDRVLRVGVERAPVLLDLLRVVLGEAPDREPVPDDPALLLVPVVEGQADPTPGVPVPGVIVGQEVQRRLDHLPLELGFRGDVVVLERVADPLPLRGPGRGLGLVVGGRLVRLDQQVAVAPLDPQDEVDRRPAGQPAPSLVIPDLRPEAGGVVAAEEPRPHARLVDRRLGLEGAILGLRDQFLPHEVVGHLAGDPADGGGVGAVLQEERDVIPALPVAAEDVRLEADLLESRDRRPRGRQVLAGILARLTMVIQVDQAPEGLGRVHAEREQREDRPPPEVVDEPLPGHLALGDGERLLLLLEIPPVAAEREGPDEHPPLDPLGEFFGPQRPLGRHLRVGVGDRPCVGLIGQPVHGRLEGRLGGRLRRARRHGRTGRDRVFRCSLLPALAERLLQRVGIFVGGLIFRLQRIIIHRLGLLSGGARGGVAATPGLLRYINTSIRRGRRHQH